MSQPVVYIVLYSLYHHVYKLSVSIKEGLESQGVQVKLFQVPETLSDTILEKMHAPPKPDIPIINVDQLAEPDGIIFGLPTRFGTMPSQMKTLLDASGALWAKGALAGKFAGTFFCTASQHGGQETTAWATITYFAHHGMLYVPFGYAHPALHDNSEVIGGSAYGAGTIAEGDGSRQPTEHELSIAHDQGKNFGAIISTFVKGKNYSVSKAATTSDVASQPNPIDTTKGNAAPANATSGIPNTPAANDTSGVAGAGVASATAAVAATTAKSRDTATTTTVADASSNGLQGKDINNGTTDTTATGPSAANAGPTATASEKATKIGAGAGATAAAAAVSTPTPENKTSKIKKFKWFCCG
ncbi:MAG: flavoprotein-like protein [Benjaminiella poitrasii]|nr:MAG: flavoprotein-like protein [Benjaminiella poitrasii]